MMIFCIINHFDDNNVVIYCDSERAIQECCDLLNELMMRMIFLNNNCKLDILLISRLAKSNIQGLTYKYGGR